MSSRARPRISPSERRPELWPGLPPDQYEVYEVGDTWAEIRDGYRGRIWVRERYDWSVRGRVQFTAVDSGFATLGSYVVVEIEPAEGGGSTLHVTWERWGKGVFGKLFVGLMALTPGRRHPPLHRVRPRPDRTHPSRG